MRGSRFALWGWSALLLLTGSSAAADAPLASAVEKQQPAAAEGHVEVVDALLKAGADFRTPLPSGFTPFFFAVREGHAEVVFRLHEAGIDLNEPMRPERNSGAARRRATSSLLLAVENGHF